MRWPRPRLSRPVQAGRAAWFAVAVAVLLGTVLLALLVGAVPLPVGGVVRTLLELPSGMSPVDHEVLVQIRLPRVLAGALVGGLLAIAGAGYQGVFQNPLADPYLLGAGAGAGLGATAVIVYAPAGASPAVPLAAFVGALFGVAMAYGLGSGAGRGPATLLLAGVAVTSFLTAVQAFVQESRTDQLERIYAWIMGSLSDADWHTLAEVGPYALVSVLILLAHGRLLDVLSVGDDEAAALGVSPARIRLLVIVAASLATACAVAVGGLIGFVGIIVPHMVRRLAGTSYRTVLPLSLLGGATFLILADLAARTVLSPAELPLGVVTAFTGAPFFVVVLRSARGRAR